MKQNIQPIAVQENAWMWIKNNYYIINSFIAIQKLEIFSLIEKKAVQSLTITST